MGDLAWCCDGEHCRELDSQLKARKTWGPDIGSLWPHLYIPCIPALTHPHLACVNTTCMHIHTHTSYIHRYTGTHKHIMYILDIYVYRSSFKINPFISSALWLQRVTEACLLMFSLFISSLQALSRGYKRWKLSLHFLASFGTVTIWWEKLHTVSLLRTGNHSSSCCWGNEQFCVTNCWWCSDRRHW